MKSVLILLLSISLYAATKQDIFQLYQNGSYEAACNKGFDKFQYYKKDESFVSLYAFACLKADYIDRLAVPIATLKYSAEARANSAYLSVIFMQKKLLYHALLDSYDLSKFHLPTTDYILSRVFDLYTDLDMKQKRSVYTFKDPQNDRISYKLYLQKQTKPIKMVIEEYENSILLQRHIYW